MQAKGALQVHMQAGQEGRCWPLSPGSAASPLTCDVLSPPPAVSGWYTARPTPPQVRGPQGQEFGAAWGFKCGPFTVTPSEPRFPHVTWRGTAPAWLGGQAGVSVGRGLVLGAAGDSTEGERADPWQECRREAERYVPETGQMDVSKARPGSDPTLVPHRASHSCRREDSAPTRARLREAGLQEAGGDL